MRSKEKIDKGQELPLNDSTNLRLNERRKTTGATTLQAVRQKEELRISGSRHHSSSRRPMRVAVDAAGELTTQASVGL
jgi:hypothetical protein